MYFYCNLAQNLKRPQNSTGKLNQYEENMGNFQSDKFLNKGTNMGQSDMNSTNATSLKGKLQTLEETIMQVSDEVNTNKKEVTSLSTEKNSLQELLKLRIHEVRNNLFTELSKLEEELNRHYKHQKAENSKLAQTLSQLKQEKMNLSNTINST